MTNTTRLLTLMLLCAPVLTGGCMADAEDGAPDGELLFNLSETDVQRIHTDYLHEEDFEATRDRLTAPFDCALYGDLCLDVGRDAAIEITERQVEQALAGVSLDEINEELDAAITQASEERRLLEAELPDNELEDEGEQFRSTGAWAIRTKGDYRLKVRNGINNPLVGNRVAWTESKLQEQDWLGVWWAVNGTEICVNTGVNEQYKHLSGTGTWILLESKDPVKQCIIGNSSYERSTTHGRYNSYTDEQGLWRYVIYARGCGSGIVNGINMGICADTVVGSF